MILITQRVVGEYAGREYTGMRGTVS